MELCTQNTQKVTVTMHCVYLMSTDIFIITFSKLFLE